MKKHTVIALVSAIAIAAGTLSAVNLTNASREAQGSVQNSGESAGISYEDAIADLYARSTSISDQEILDIARKMKPDCTAVTSQHFLTTRRRRLLICLPIRLQKRTNRWRRSGTDRRPIRRWESQDPRS